MMRSNGDVQMTKRGEMGFTLPEVLTVVVIMMILMAIAAPIYSQWRRNLTYRDATRQIISFMRDAKSDAISTNRQRRTDFDTANRRFGLRIGDRANDTNWVAIPAPAFWTNLDRDVTLIGPNTNLTEGATHYIVFNPNGTASTTGVGFTRIVVRDDTGTDRFWVEVTPSGRIRAEQRN